MSFTAKKKLLQRQRAHANNPSGWGVSEIFKSDEHLLRWIVKHQELKHKHLRALLGISPKEASNGYLKL